MSTSVEEWHGAARDAERRGDFLHAFDLVEQGLSEHPDDLSLGLRLVGVLAQAGAADQARDRLLALPVDAEALESRRLHARLAKDLALAAAGAERSQQATSAALLFHQLYEHSKDPQHAVEAAALFVVAGDQPRARQLAHLALEAIPGASTGASTDPSPGASTDLTILTRRAQAFLVLGDLVAARQAIAAAAPQASDSAVGPALQQLELLCAELDVSPRLLDPLRGGTVVVCYTGPRCAEVPDELLEQLAVSVHRAVAELQPDVAYGSLNAGAELLWAEAVLAAGAELHVVLPTSAATFADLAASPQRKARVEACLEAATSVDHVTVDALDVDETLLAHAEQLCRGRALLRGRFLHADVVHLALGEAPDRGRERTVRVPLPAGWPTSRELPMRRAVRAVIFADVRGFSGLGDEQAATFGRVVLGAFDDVLDRHPQQVLEANTWGDGLHVVVDDVLAAAAVALEIQEAFGALDLLAHGLPDTLALRLGAHVGPVFEVRDEVRERIGFFGSHVSRTARIEPVTPPGTVYVTEAFAALLEAHAQTQLVCDYVGYVPAAKGYGVLRMHRLRRAVPREPR